MVVSSQIKRSGTLRSLLWLLFCHFSPLLKSRAWSLLFGARSSASVSSRLDPTHRELILYVPSDSFPCPDNILPPLQLGSRKQNVRLSPIPVNI
ncbi:hypothetical protein B0H19DRAFT_1200679 [Mycena capillaripes]|nr:hypothetical protein B0H19DRAFT_1200679 [Mycena capillaripes]